MADRSEAEVAASPIFCRQPTSLEAAISQAANDLKVTGFGQHTRAILRRNRAANDKTILPHASYKDVMGPDLVRDLNALFLMHSETPNPLALTRLDQELIAVLNGQLDVARAIVATLWAGPLSECAGLFLDYDNVPVPFCPMYPSARDLIGMSQITLPQPLTKIVQRLREQIGRVESMEASLTRLPDLTPTYLRHLRTTKENFITQSAYQQGETIGGWQERVHRLIADARSAIPAPLIQLNRLIHVTVLCAVSLAVWDYNITVDDVLSCDQWGIATMPESSPDAEQPNQTRDAWPYGPEIPNGYELRTGTTNLTLLPFDACVRLQAEGKLRSIAIVIGASISWSRGQDIDARLRIAEFSSYEFGRIEGSSQ